MRLSNEEKIKRLEAQIEALKNGIEPDVAFENEHFYIRRRGRGTERDPYYYMIFMKSGNAIEGSKRPYSRTGYQIHYTSLDQWFKDAKEMVDYMNSDN